MPYKMVEQDGQYCIMKEGGEMVKGSCHADKGETENMMRAMYANEKMEAVFLGESFVSTRPGEPYRLLPVGKLVKGGVKRDITPELLAQFRLPHFKPPIKLGSHDEPTPAGGQIVGLEVRADGLYAIPEMTDKGAQAMADGSYRYHSPEIIWGDSGLEDPQTGEVIRGPLIVGDALLHTPHLGEAAALYSIEPLESEEKVMSETVQVDKTLWDKFTAWIGKRVDEPEKLEKPAEPPAPVAPDEFKAQLESATKERDELKAQLDALNADKAKAARVETFAAQLKETKVAEGADILAGMSDEQAAWVVSQFKALSAQVDASALFAEKGTSGGGAANPLDALDAAIKAKSAELKTDYATALNALRSEKPELFKV